MQPIIESKLRVQGFKNKIINGNFDIWQRGTSFTANGYTADRFYCYKGVGGTPAFTISRQAFTIGQTDVPNEPRYFLRFNQTAISASERPGIYQNIEGVRTLAGKTCVLTFYAKVASGTLTVSPELVQYFGTGGTPSALVRIFSSPVNVTASWQKFTRVFVLPSISGKTLGTDGNDSLAVELNFPINATFTIDIAQIQLEEGSVATDFEMRPIAEELALCQRYYEKSYNLEVVPGTITGVGATRCVTLTFAAAEPTNGMSFFKVKKRTIPSITIYSPATGSPGYVECNGDRSSIPGVVGEGSFTVFASPGNYPTGLGLSYHWVASAEL